MERSGRVGIVAALAAEARALGPAVHSNSSLASLPDGALIAVSGMGLQAAERSARALVDAGCSALVSWGLAGGLDPRVSTGTVVVPEVSVLEGAPDLSTSSAWRARVLGSVPGAAGGRLLTSREALASAADKRAAFLRSGAVAVDLESYAIAAVAEARSLPFIALRAIVDEADDEVPRFLLNVAAPRGGLAIAPLVLGILASPRSLAPLLRLARRFAVARRSLRALARAGAPGSAPERISA